MCAIDMHQSLLRKGYRISYSSVCNYVRNLKQESQEVSIHESYLPGQAVEFDWAMVKLRIGGVDRRLQLAVFSSCYSNYRWARLYDREDMNSFLDSHVEYLHHTGGSPKQLVYDNMRVAIKRYAQKNIDKEPTDQLLQLLSYYQISYRFCNARRGNEKGHVEKSVEFVRRKAFCEKDIFTSLEQANRHLEQSCKLLNEGCVKDKQSTIIQDFKEELQHMSVVPPQAFDTAKIQQLRVDKLSLIKIDTNYYSVLEGHVDTLAMAKVYATKIEIYNSKNQLIGTHQRYTTRFKYYIDLNHYLKTLQRKPGALIGSTAWRQADSNLQRIYNQYFTDESKDFIELLLFLKQKQICLSDFIKKLDNYALKFPHKTISCAEIKVLITSSEQTQNKTNTPLNQAQQPNAIQQHCKKLLKKIQTQFSL